MGVDLPAVLQAFHQAMLCYTVQLTAATVAPRPIPEDILVNQQLGKNAILFPKVIVSNMGALMGEKQVVFDPLGASLLNHILYEPTICRGLACPYRSCTNESTVCWDIEFLAVLAFNDANKVTTASLQGIILSGPRLPQPRRDSVGSGPAPELPLQAI